MHNSLQTKLLNAFCLLLMLGSGLFRIIDLKFFTLGGEVLVGIFFTVALLIWSFQVQKRLVNPDEIRFFKLAIGFMIGYMMLRTLKLVFVDSNSLLERYIWYLYYTPHIFTVLFMFMAIQHLDRKKINNKFRLLYIPASILAFLIFTNDFHQLMFRFDGGIEHWYSSRFTYGPLYYIQFAWIVGLLIGIMSTVFIKSFRIQRKRKVWAPFIPLIVGALYYININIDPLGIIRRIYLEPEVFVIIFSSFMETLILTRLFHSNDNHGLLWNHASFRGGIIDKVGNLKYASQNTFAVSSESIIRCENTFQIGDYVLNSKEISGGFSYWFKNIKEISRLNAELLDKAELLEKENQMLVLENKYLQDKKNLQSQNDIYDEITRSISGQMNNLSILLDKKNDDEDKFVQDMKYASVLNIFIKRFSSLYITYKRHELMSSDELTYAISESLEYTNLFGLTQRFECNGSGEIPSEFAILIYKLFQEVLETALPGASNLHIDLSFSSEMVNFYIRVDEPRLYFEPSEETQKLGDYFKIEINNGIQQINLELPVINGGGVLINGNIPSTFKRNSDDFCHPIYDSDSVVDMGCY